MRGYGLFIQIDAKVGDILGGLLTSFHADDGERDFTRQCLPQELLHRQMAEEVAHNPFNGDDGDVFVLRHQKRICFTIGLLLANRLFQPVFVVSARSRGKGAI